MRNQKSQSKVPDYENGVLKAILRSSTMLDLSWAELNDKDILQLADALRGRAEALNIKTINLVGNCFGPKGAAALADVLRINGLSIRELRLDEKSVYGPEAGAALQSLRQIKPRIAIVNAVGDKHPIMVGEQPIGRHTFASRSQKSSKIVDHSR